MTHWFRESDLVGEKAKTTRDFIKSHLQLWHNEKEYSLGHVDLNQLLQRKPRLTSRFLKRPNTHLVNIEEIVDENIARIIAHVSLFASPLMGDYRKILLFQQNVASGAISCLAEPNAFAFKSPVSESAFGIILDAWLDRAFFAAQMIWYEFSLIKPYTQAWFFDQICNLVCHTFWPTAESRSVFDKFNATENIALMTSTNVYDKSNFKSKWLPYLAAIEFAVCHEMGHIYRHLARAYTPKKLFASISLESFAYDHSQEIEADYWGVILNAYAHYMKVGGEFFTPKARSQVEYSLSGATLFFGFIRAMEAVAHRLGFVLPSSHPPAIMRFNEVLGRISSSRWQIPDLVFENFIEQIEWFGLAATEGQLPYLDLSKIDYRRLDTSG